MTGTHGLLWREPLLIATVFLTDCSSYVFPPETGAQISCVLCSEWPFLEKGYSWG